MIVGAGSLLFDLLKALTDRLPVMICLKWLTTPTQPIAVDDVLAYLLAANDLPGGEGRIFEIGGTDVVTYGDLIREYARLKHLRRRLTFVPVLTPTSRDWLQLPIAPPARYNSGSGRPDRPPGALGRARFRRADSLGVSARVSKYVSWGVRP
jgi:uncharacterized protein YbjT (DUF2867 family)